MKNRVITISREFGSGGRTIGKQVAEELGIPCYDRELIQQVAEKSGFTENYEGIILGVERNLLPVVSPNKDFVILENDIMWTLGAQNMLDAMVRAGLLEE